MRGPLIVGNQMLNIPLGHHRGFSCAGTGVEGDVAIEVEAKPLTVVEAHHQRAPPSSATSQAS